MLIAQAAFGKIGMLTEKPVHRNDALRMVKRRALDVGILSPIGCHTFRATGITAYLLNNGSLEKAQMMAAHESPRTTKLYDRTNDQISLDEVERILLTQKGITEGGCKKWTSHLIFLFSAI